LEVSIHEGESQESLLRRFQKMVQMSGILREVKANRHFVPKSEAARRRLREMYEASTQEECEELRDQYVAELMGRGQRSAAETVLRDWEDFVNLPFRLGWPNLP
jgi:ribosomal protein S21